MSCAETKIIFRFSEYYAFVALSRLEKRGERVVTIVRRDAMDVGCIVRRMMTASDGQVAWSWRPWAGAKL
jgi:hypothetical protein